MSKEPTSWEKLNPFQKVIAGIGIAGIAIIFVLLIVGGIIKTGEWVRS